MTYRESPADTTDPLPVPTTTRNMQPRSRATSLARSRASGSRSVSRSSSGSGSLGMSRNSSAAITRADAEMGVSTSVPFVASGKRSVTDSDDVECERKRRKTGGSTNTGKGKGKEVDLTSQDVIPPVLQSPSQPDPLSSYCCPICFSPPTNATLTPCGHICCGSCLFTAVKSMVERGQLLMPGEQALARCPVCRAPIPGWDAKGGGVIGLKTRAVLTL